MFMNVFKSFELAFLPIFLFFCFFLSVRRFPLERRTAADSI